MGLGSRRPFSLCLLPFQVLDVTEIENLLIHFTDANKKSASEGKGWGVWERAVLAACATHILYIHDRSQPIRPLHSEANGASFELKVLQLPSL